MLGFMSAALDYSALMRHRAVLQVAADAAALAAVNSNVTTSTTDAATLQANALVAAQAAFRGNLNAALAPVATMTLNYAKNQGAYVAIVDASATVKNAMGFIVGSTTIGAHAHGSAALSAANFINIHVLVDSSQSMGLGADPADQTNMLTNSGIECSLACHKDTYHGDTVVKAKAAGYKLRIDVVRAAIKAMIAQAQSVAVQTGATIKIGLYTFDVNFHTLSQLSNQYATLSANADKLDIAGFSAGTSTRHGLQQLAALIGATGDGSTAAAPLTYVMLMTDGVANSVDNTESGAWNGASTAYPAYDYNKVCWNQTPPPDSGPFYAPTGLPAATPCIPDPWTRTHGGNGQMQLQPLDPAWCDLVKTRGASVMTLYTTYTLLPAASTDTTNWTTNDWRAPMLQNYIIPRIQPAMAACASNPALAYTGGNSAAISASVAAMAKAALNKPPRLTN
jgi:Flp pilus assembly protein TadG